MMWRETDYVGSAPRERFYYFDGVQMGDVSNDGTSNVDYVTSITRHRAVPGSIFNFAARRPCEMPRSVRSRRRFQDKSARPFMGTGEHFQQLLRIRETHQTHKLDHAAADGLAFTRLNHAATFPLSSFRGWPTWVPKSRKQKR